jgi:hypothetical protein
VRSKVMRVSADESFELNGFVSMSAYGGLGNVEVNVCFSFQPRIAKTPNCHPLLFWIDKRGR